MFGGDIIKDNNYDYEEYLLNPIVRDFNEYLVDQGFLGVELDEKSIIARILNNNDIDFIRKKIQKHYSVKHPKRENGETQKKDYSVNLFLDSYLKNLLNEFKIRVEKYFEEDVKLLLEMVEEELTNTEESQEQYAKIIIDNFKKAIIILQELQKEDYYEISANGEQAEEQEKLRFIILPDDIDNYKIGDDSTVLSENLEYSRDEVNDLDNYLCFLEAFLKAYHEANGDLNYFPTKKYGSGIHNDDGHYVYKNINNDDRLLFTVYNSHTVVILGMTNAHTNGQNDESRHKYYVAQEKKWKSIIEDKPDKERKRILDDLENRYNVFKNELFLKSAKSDLDSEIIAFIDRVVNNTKGENQSEKISEI